MGAERFVAFDVEATGTPSGQICQIAYLIVEEGGIRGKNFYLLTDEMGEVAAKLHGLTLERLAVLSGGARFEDMAEEIYSDFAPAARLIGHNVSADIRLLRAEFQRLGREFPPVPALCSMQALRLSVNAGYLSGGRKRPKPPSLKETMAHYEIAPEKVSSLCGEWFGGGGDFHDARFDAAASLLCLAAAQFRGDIGKILPGFLESRVICE